MFGPANTLSAQWTGGPTGPIYYNGGNVGIGTASPSFNLGASTPHTLITQIKGALVLGGTSQNGNDDGLLQFGAANFSGGNNWTGYGFFGTNMAVKSVGNTDTFYTPLTHPWIGYAAMVTSALGIQFFTATGATTGGAAVTRRHGCLLTLPAASASGRQTRSLCWPSMAPSRPRRSW